MRRKRFTIEDWKGAISLLIAALKDHNKSYDQIVDFKNRLVKIGRLSKKESADLEYELGVFCNCLNKDIWELFLKKCRDDKYEKKSSRKRLSVHSDIFDELNGFINNNNFDNANQAIAYLLKNISDYESPNREVGSSSKRQRERSYVPVKPRISIRESADGKPIVPGISIA